MATKNQGRGSSGGMSSGRQRENEGGRASAHSNAAFHHDTAAHHHRQAAKHHAAGNTGEAELHGRAARMHGQQAREHGDRADPLGMGRGESTRNRDRRDEMQDEDRLARARMIDEGGESRDEQEGLGDYYESRGADIDDRDEGNQRRPREARAREDEEANQDVRDRDDERARRNGRIDNRTSRGVS